MAAPTIVYDKPFYTFGDEVKATVVYDPLTVTWTAVAPNGDQASAPISFKVKITSDISMTLVRVSDDGHTAVFKGVF